MLDTTVWIAQGFLALFFLGAGLPKVLGKGIDRWVGFDEVPRPLTILTGIAEVAAAVGLVVPVLVDDGQWLTPLAALGLAVISLMASGFHLRAHESLPAVETALWASLAASIAIAHWGEMSTGPDIPDDALIPVLALLVTAIVVNLVVLLRTSAPEDVDTPGPVRAGK
jgi:hypothetical protein